MKQKSFAAAVNRDDITRGAEELGVDLNEHIEFVAAALRERADALGLAPQGCLRSIARRSLLGWAGRTGEELALWHG